MINYQSQKMYTASSNEKAQLIQIYLSSFLTTCETAGIGHNDFRSIIRSIVNDVIDAADEDSPTRRLKRPLFFLREIENFLNNVEVG